MMIRMTVVTLSTLVGLGNQVWPWPACQLRQQQQFKQQRLLLLELEGGLAHTNHILGEMVEFKEEVVGPR